MRCTLLTHPMTYKEFVSSKTVIIVLTVFLLFMSYLKWQQYRQQRSVDLEKQNMMLQVQAWEKKNSDLTESLNNLNSPDFKERMARSQLNLKKDGEVVYNFSTAPEAAIPTDAQTQDQNQSNFQKWINYFAKP